MKKIIKKFLTCTLFISSLIMISGCGNNSQMDGVWVRVSKDKVKNVSDSDIKRIEKKMTNASKKNYTIYQVIFIEGDSYRYYINLYDSKKLLYEGKEDTDKYPDYNKGKLKETKKENNYDVCEEEDGKVINKKPGRIKYVNENVIVVEKSQDTDYGITPFEGTYVRVDIQK